MIDFVENSWIFKKIARRRLKIYIPSSGGGGPDPHPTDPKSINKNYQWSRLLKNFALGATNNANLFIQMSKLSNLLRRLALNFQENKIYPPVEPFEHLQPELQRRRAKILTPWTPKFCNKIGRFSRLLRKFELGATNNAILLMQINNASNPL